MNIWFLRPSTGSEVNQESDVFDQAHLLAQKGHSVSIFGNDADPRAVEGVRIVHVNSLLTHTNDLLFAIGAYKTGSRADAELPHAIVASSRHPFSALASYFLAKRYQAKFIFFQAQKERAKRGYVENFCARRASHVFDHDLDAFTENIETAMRLSFNTNSKQLSKTPSVSAVLPARNEIVCIRSCLESIVQNTYPKDNLEILVVDGMSTDGTRAILTEYAQRYPFIKIFDNPRFEQQLAMNIGIAAAKGEIILRLGAHDRYQPNYIEECVTALQTHPADNVGGGWVATPRDNTLVGRSICFALSVPFGVGNAYYRLTELNSHEPYLRQPRWEIHIAYPCCRREVFEKIGPFNENLTRSEDIDFRSRIKKAGYRTLYVPTIRCNYMMRTQFMQFVRHMFLNGQWVLLPLNHAPNISFSFRHIVPVSFLMLLATTAALSFHNPVCRYLIFSLSAAYAAINLYYSLRISLREKDIRYAALIPVIFLSLHFAYGLGSAVAAVKLIMGNLFSPNTKTHLGEENLRT